MLIGDGLPIRAQPGTGTTARYVGADLDLLASYNFTRHLLGYVGYNDFFTGEFIWKTGLSRDSDFLYGESNTRFEPRPGPRRRQGETGPCVDLWGLGALSGGDGV